VTIAGVMLSGYAWLLDRRTPGASEPSDSRLPTGRSGM